jgi:hypothetical protein
MDLKLVALLAAVVLGLVLFFALGERTIDEPGLPDPDVPTPAPEPPVRQSAINIEGAKQSWTAALGRSPRLEAEGMKVEPRVLIEGGACSWLLAPAAAAELPVAGIAKRVLIEGAATADVSHLPVWDATPTPSPAPRVVVESSASVGVLGVGEGTEVSPGDAVTDKAGIAIEGAATSAVYQLVGAPLP